MYLYRTIPCSLHKYKRDLNDVLCDLVNSLIEITTIKATKRTNPCSLPKYKRDLNALLCDLVSSLIEILSKKVIRDLKKLIQMLWSYRLKINKFKRLKRKFYFF